MTDSLRSLGTSELFKMYRGVLRELTDRGIVRTMNAPAGDYAEYLVAALTKGELADNSEKSWDIKTPEGERLQVKCRVVQEGKRGQRQLSPFRTWDFDRAVIVLFDDNYGIQRCVALPRAVVEEHATYRSHVNGHVVRATDALLDHPSGQDLTEDLRNISADL
jgi:hypothetical protein